MMRKVSRHWQITASLVFSGVLIGGAYFLAHSVDSPSVAQASEETALLQAIATKDSSGDGLPDWQKTLYGIPINATTTDYFHLGMTDGEAVAKGLIVPQADAYVPLSTSSPMSLGANGLPPAPAENTLTATFARSFFTLFMAAKQANGGADLSESQMNDVANQAINSLGTSIRPVANFKTAQDIVISNSSPEAFKNFAVSAEAVLMNNTANATTTALQYLKRALLNNDATAFEHILSIAKAYRDTAYGIAKLPVPQELAADDLLLVNSMMHLGEIIADFAHANDDPLVAILALKQYMGSVQSMGTAFLNIGKIYATTGISLPSGTPGAALVNLAADTAKEESTTTKTQ